MASKYKRQEKHIRNNYKRFPIDIRPEVLDAFKEKCKENGTAPTTEIKKFINVYIEK